MHTLAFSLFKIRQSNVVYGLKMQLILFLFKFPYLLGTYLVYMGQII